MRERKYVKLKVDMYDDTKFKIIDMKPERDLIHYVWTRLVTLAGKVNLDGELYMSKNIPYTIETLGIEFNRGADQVKLALDIFIELEMIELTKDSVYKVINFVKHQNIKRKSEDKPVNKSKDIKQKEEAENRNTKIDIYHNVDKEFEIKNSKDEVQSISNNKAVDFEVSNKTIRKTDNIDDIKESRNDSQDNIPIILKAKRNRSGTKKKKKDIISEVADEEVGENDICCFYDGDKERPLGEGEKVVGAWNF